MILKDIKKRIFTALVLLLVVTIIIKYDPLLLFFLIIFGIFSIVEFFNIIKKITKNKLFRLIYNLSFIIFIFIYCSLFFFFSGIIQLKIVLFILLFGCIASDVGGLIIGKIFKGPKLTNISPNKTISGALGSIFFSAIIMGMLFFYFTKGINLNLLSVCVFTSIGCQLGDLFFSFLKRKAKIKDTGNILPGHGGVLDRLDGIFLGVPIGFISINIFL
jgi:phosphatidate cytidylyltransferase